MKIVKTAVMAGALALASGAALAAGYFTNGLPPAGGTQYPATLPLTGNETVPADTNLGSGLNPASEAITIRQLSGSNYASAGSGGWRNVLVGGDFGTNLWQRGVGPSSDISNTLTYFADQWWNLGGASSAIDVTKETGAADITQGYAASLRFQRKSGNTDTAAICTGNVAVSANSTRFQGQVTEFSAHLLAGANFSGASSQLTMTISYGAGSDQSAASFAAGTWTGQASTNQVTTISTTWTRFSVVATVPVTTTQIGVKICYTPVGTAGTNDWFEMAGAQLDVNPAADNYDGTVGSSSNIASFERVPAAVEAMREYGYYYQLNETNGGYFVPGMISATNVERGVLGFPATMRAVPTCTFTAGGFKWNLAGTNTSVGTLTQVTGSTTQFLTIGDTVTGTAGGTAFLNGSNTTGAVKCSAEL